MHPADGLAGPRDVRTGQASASPRVAPPVAPAVAPRSVASTWARALWEGRPMPAQAPHPHDSRPTTVVERLDRAVRRLSGWDALFFALTAVAAVAIVIPGTTGSRTWWALAVIVALVAAYVLVGRGAMDGHHPRRADAYLALLLPLTAVCTALTSAGFVLLFVAYTQIWFFSRSRLRGAVWCTGLTVVVIGAATVAAGGWREDLVGFAAQMLASRVFSIVLGLWITMTAEQSEERAELLRRLEAAQAELAATHHAAGVVAERQRLAQEIHDTLAQGFTSVVMLAQTTQAELDRGRPEAARTRVTQIEQVARDNLAEARSLVAAFGPAGLRDASLGEALVRLAERFSAEADVQVQLAGDHTAGDDLPREAQVVLLRSAQEALANIRKHAAARSVTLRLVRADDVVRLEVEDDGRGLPPGTTEGNGLRGMRERAHDGGGSLQVERGPAGGTRVAVTVPTGTTGAQADGGRDAGRGGSARAAAGGAR
ncbi:sensor histidine kinase [uncultured Cellulomonas sp.]|uniref:sensor histidine kinase n=1 Tax=uncultured Cellulomonas sp. TaxID=189682 RepID=UPI00261DACEC|nr:sensor histidine kinase [uncultured Cellulomonas sp.]